MWSSMRGPPSSMSPRIQNPGSSRPTRKFESVPHGHRQLPAVFGCIRGVPSVFDDVFVIINEGSTVFNVTQVSDLTFLWFAA